jgi:hypothetical protein
MSKVDGRGPLSRRAQAKWSADKQLRELSFLLGQAGLRKDIHIFGGLVVHDGTCPHPAGPCDCEPLALEPRPPRGI